MGRSRDGEPSKFTTPYGKKVICLTVSAEIELRIVKAAQKKGLTRQSYIMVAINEQLDKDEAKTNAGI